MTVQDKIESFCKEFFVSHATFQMFSLANSSTAAPYVKTTYPVDWVSFYLINNLITKDPVVRFSQTAKTAFFWSDIPCTASEYEMMEHAYKHGISTNGYTIPTTDVGPYKGLFSICSRIETDADEWRTYITENISAIEHNAYSLHVAARIEIDPYESYVVTLTQRETECLSYIAAGKTNTEIAIILDLSEHTVRSYCRTLRLKLNCSTLAQAVAKAINIGII